MKNGGRIAGARCHFSSEIDVFRPRSHVGALFLPLVSPIAPLAGEPDVDAV
jgi:hypothetical protein